MEANRRIIHTFTSCREYEEAKQYCF